MKNNNDHIDSFGVDDFGDDTSLRSDVLDHFEQSPAFDFLPFEITQWICHKVKQHATLLDLLHEQFFPLRC